MPRGGGENLQEGTSCILVEFYAIHYGIIEWPNADRDWQPVAETREYEAVAF